MKNRKNILSIIILVLLSVLEFLIAMQVWQLNIVPFKYFLSMIAAVLLLDLLIARLLLSRIKRKKKPEESGTCHHQKSINYEYPF